MKRILLATDGSAPAVEALEFAIEDDEETGRIARAAAERARAAGIRAEPLTAYGQPAAEIARVAKERSADLIVAGSHGLGAIRGALLGSSHASDRAAL
jgi:nucleotide-binding universal stress UspA family protein